MTAQGCRGGNEEARFPESSRVELVGMRETRRAKDRLSIALSAAARETAICGAHNFRGEARQVRGATAKFQIPIVRQVVRSTIMARVMRFV